MSLLPGSVFPFSAFQVWPFLTLSHPLLSVCIWETSSPISTKLCLCGAAEAHTICLYPHTEPTKTRCCGSPAVSLGCCSAPASTAHWLCSEQSWHCHRTSECVSGPIPSAQCSPVATCPATTPRAPVCVSWSVLCSTLLWFVYCWVAPYSLLSSKGHISPYLWSHPCFPPTRARFDGPIHHCTWRKSAWLA